MSSDYVYEGFLGHLKTQKTKHKGVGIALVNFEHFQAEIIGDGKIDLARLSELAEWSTKTLQILAHQLNFIFQYHPESPKRVWNELKKEEGRYCIGLNLEEVMDSSAQEEQKDRIEQLGYFIPDNYELAKKVMRAFKRLPENKKYKLEDISFRDTAMWETRSVRAAKALSQFIYVRYIEPRLNEILKQNKISQCIFKKNKSVVFKYEKD